MSRGRRQRPPLPKPHYGSFAYHLMYLKACDAGRRWVGGMTVDQAWERAENCGWMEWLLHKANPSLYQQTATWPKPARTLFAHATPLGLRHAFRDQIQAWAHKHSLRVVRKAWVEDRRRRQLVDAEAAAAAHKNAQIRP